MSDNIVNTVLLQIRLYKPPQSLGQFLREVLVPLPLYYPKFNHLVPKPRHFYRRRHKKKQWLKSALQIAVSGQKTPHICSFSLSSLGIKSIGFVFPLKLSGFHYNIPVSSIYLRSIISFYEPQTELYQLVATVLFSWP